MWPCPRRANSCAAVWNGNCTRPETGMKHDRLAHLLDRYLDGTLTGGEKLELERTLKESPEGRRRFWEHTSLHGLSYEAAKVKWSEHPQTEPEVSSDAGAANNERWHAAFAGVWWRWTWARSLAVGMGLVLAMVSLFHVWKQNRTVAVLARAVDVEWMDGGKSLGEGVALKPDWLRLKRGAVLVEFKGGARVAFEAP